MNLKELSIEELVEVINAEVKDGLSVNAVIKKYNSSKSTIINKLSKNNYKFDEELKQYLRVQTLEEVQRIRIQSLEDKIQRLEEYNTKLEEEVKKLQQTVIKLDEDIEFRKKISVYDRTTIERLREENTELKNNAPTATKVKNERNAGRKARTVGRGNNKREITQQDIATMQMYRLQGKSIRAIADIYSCSVGLVHKLINE